jgi:hypothetical protein
MTRYLSLAALAGLTVLAACGASDLTGPSSPAPSSAATRPLTPPQTASANRESHDRDEQLAALLAAHVANAEKCLNGGYLKYTRSDGAAFSGVLQCVAYALLGGTLVPVATTTAPTITSFTYDGLQNADCSVSGGPLGLFTAVFTGGTGTTATITDPHGTTTSVTSGQQVALASPLGGNYTLTVTNSAGSVNLTLTNPIATPGALVGCSSGLLQIRRLPTGVGSSPSGL